MSSAFIDDNTPKIWLTGADGLLASYVKPLLFAHPFIATSRKQLNIIDFDSVNRFITAHNITTIINCAAYTNVDKAEHDKKKAADINTLAVHNLARQLQQRNGRLIHISTDYVFDGQTQKPYHEDDTARPLNNYGKTKAAAERLIQETCLNFIIIRTSWLYGSCARPSFFTSVLQRFINNKPVAAVDDQYGTPTYAGDLAQIILRFLEQPEQQGIFHYSHAGVTNKYNYAKLIGNLLNIYTAGYTAPQVYPVASKNFMPAAIRPSYSVLSKSKIRQKLKVTIPEWDARLTQLFPFLIQ